MTSNFSEKNRERPKHIKDFDINFGFHHLQPFSNSEKCQVWTTSLLINYVCLALFLLILGSCVMLYFNPPVEMNHISQRDIIIISIVSIFAILILAFLFTGIFHRGKLVLNREEKTLKFFKGLVWPRQRWNLPLIEIVAIENRNLDAINADLDSTPWTYKIIVAELQDGKLASIAFDSAPGITNAIREEIPNFPIQNLT